MKSKYKDLLNALVDMQASGQYAVRKHILAEAEQLIVSLESQLAEAQKDTSRLDYVLGICAFTLRVFTGTFPAHYQLVTQDEDENYVTLSGEGATFVTPRQAIDAAMQR